MGQLVRLDEARNRRVIRHADGPLLTKARLAQELGVTPRTVENWQRDPEFPVHRFGPGTVRYRLSEVELHRSRVT